MRHEKRCPLRKKDTSTHAGKLRFQQPPVTASVRDSSGTGNIYRKRDLYRCNKDGTFSSKTRPTAIAQQYECVGVQPQQNNENQAQCTKFKQGGWSVGCSILLLFDFSQNNNPQPSFIIRWGSLCFQLKLSYNNHFPCGIISNFDKVNSRTGNRDCYMLIKVERTICCSK